MFLVHCFLHYIIVCISFSIVQLLIELIPKSQQSLELYINKNISIYVRISVNSVCMYVCMYVCIHVCMYACMYVCMYVCRFVYICVCMCVHLSYVPSWNCFCEFLSDIGGSAENHLIGSTLVLLLPEPSESFLVDLELAKSKVSSWLVSSRGLRYLSSDEVLVLDWANESLSSWVNSNNWLVGGARISSSLSSTLL